MRSRRFVVVASLCLMAVLLAAIVPTAGDAAFALLASAPRFCAPAPVRCSLGSVLIGPPDTFDVDRAPARAPPLA